MDARESRPAGPSTEVDWIEEGRARVERKERERKERAQAKEQRQNEYHQKQYRKQTSLQQQKYAQSYAETQTLLTTRSAADRYALAVVAARETALTYIYTGIGLGLLALLVVVVLHLPHHSRLVRESECEGCSPPPPANKFSIPSRATPLGSVSGVTVEAAEGLGTYSAARVDQYLGLRYSPPRTGADRFKPATLLTSTWSDTLDASAPGKTCIFFRDDPDADEDCLLLNVYTPAAHMPDPQALPVLVIVYGTKLIKGGSIEMEMNGANLAATQGIVVVTVQYRLGPLGFLVLPEVNVTGTGTGGMNGYHDIVVALQWVKTYISFFGGNQNEVTLVGSGAGAVAACSLGVSPLASALFLRAAFLSGTCNSHLWGPSSADAGAAAAAALMAAVAAPDLAALQALDANELSAEAWPADFHKFFMHPPSLDGWVLNDLPQDLYSTGSTAILNFNELLVGATSFDGQAAIDQVTGYRDIPTTQDEYLPAIIDLLQGIGLSNVSQVAIDAMALYSPSDTESVSTMYAKLAADACVVCPSIWFADFVAVTNNVHHYMFEYGPVASDLAVMIGAVDEMAGGSSSGYASHQADLPFWMQNSCGIPKPGGGAVCVGDDGAWGSATGVMATRALAASVGSVASGRAPTFVSIGDYQTGDWTSTASGTPQSMVINTQASMVSGYRQVNCEFWEQRIA